jgi:aspartate carbamoyltransferase catalytic subunit
MKAATKKEEGLSQGARHLLGIGPMERAEIESLLEATKRHKEALSQRRDQKILGGKVVANLFFEDSTRTRSSFEIAAKALGASVLNWSVAGSSLSKGETLLDTARNVDAMGPSAMVSRHRSSGAADWVSQHVRAAVINAGDGTHEHPSQGLLDAFTLWERWHSFEGKTVLIVGDILHSRVARSNVLCLSKLGADVVLCGPATLLSHHYQAVGARIEGDLDAAISSADAVIVLRLQLERQHDCFIPSAREYAKFFGIDGARARKMKKGAIVLHPGPINRGVELSNDVADGAQSVILQQVQNGVAVRMSILERFA